MTARRDPADVMRDLQDYGALPDEEINLAAAALDLAALHHPGLSLERYYNHLKKLIAETEAFYAQSADKSKRVTLRAIIATAHHYARDDQTPEDLQNADLVRVIDRRRGGAAALAVIVLHVGRALGWRVEALNFPGDNLPLRLEEETGPILFDPGNDFKILHAADLRQMVKGALGPQAELSADYYAPLSNRALLVRLQNFIKTRQIAGEDYEGALQTVRALQAIDPQEYRLLLDAGVLCARLKKLEEAVAALERYIGLAPHDRDRAEAAYLLQSIKEIM